MIAFMCKYESVRNDPVTVTHLIS